MMAALVLLGTGRMASQKDDVRKRQVELQSLRDQIKEFEERIKTQQEREQNTLELLDAYDRKATVVRKLITRLRAEEKSLQDSIEVTRREITSLRTQLDFLKNHYAGYVVAAYKSGQLQDIELLLAARSLNQFYVRAEYLRRFSEQRKNDITRIHVKKGLIEEKQARLQDQLSDERRLIAEKGAEEDKLAVLTADRTAILNRIRKDKRNAQRELDRKMQSARDLEKMITSLIEQERVRRERETAERQRTGKLPQPAPVIGAFGAKKGKLRWPVSQGALVARFGNQRHPTLKTVTQNTGIDISVKPGTGVSTVADGEVATIWWLPSYGNIVIIDHSQGYRTVYSHLAEIRVSQGQSMKEGEVIGTSGETIDGPRLHFEIWKDREKQNPEHWLSPQER
jgi:septal ring factor EnvC (AmiA/AmiB activator)